MKTFASIDGEFFAGIIHTDENKRVNSTVDFNMDAGCANEQGHRPHPSAASTPVILPESWKDHARIHSLDVERVTIDCDAYHHILDLRSRAYQIPFDREVDNVDRKSILYLVRHKNEPVATLRVTYARVGSLDCEKFFPTTLIEKFRDTICSASRFCALPKMPPELKIARLIIETAWREAVDSGIRLDLIDVNVKAIRYYQRLGYTLIPGFRFTHPLLGTQSEVMACSVDPENPGPLQELFATCKDPLPITSVLNCLDDKLKFTSYREVSDVSPIEVMKSTSIEAGSILSFSAGSTTINPTKYRCVRPQPGKFNRLLTRFPRLADFLAGITPIVVNCYPAPVGQIPNAILVDTYGRSASFSNALELASRSQLPAVVIGMPLTLAHLTQLHIARGCCWPRKVALFAGGYSCPNSLEQFLKNLLCSVDVCCELVQLYGVAELDSGLMAAMDRDHLGTPIFEPIDDRWRPIVEDKILAFFDSDSKEQTVWKTEDYADKTGKGYSIRTSELRMCKLVDKLLASWTPLDWHRKTGFLRFEGGEILSQLRRGHEPVEPLEISYHDYLKHADISWLEKPCWSSIYKSHDCAHTCADSELSLTRLTTDN